MTLEPLPDDLRRFLLTAVPSVPYLEAMLLMRREAGSDWTADVLARRLFIGEREAAELLAQLHAAGALAGDPAFGPSRYGPADAALAALVDRLAERYARDLVGVTRLIHARIERTATQFADAFKFRKDH